MEIAFQTKALRTVCLSGDAMDKRYGPEGGAQLRERLADIRAAECLRDVPLLVFFPVPSSLGDEIAMDVGAGLTIIFKANQQKPPKLRNGGIDWSRINRILIQRIEREHG